jgi:hypothetical protein
MFDFMIKYLNTLE